MDLLVRTKEGTDGAREGSGMSLEDAVNRLTEAVQMQNNRNDAAVAEIIRQRDAWKKQSERDSTGAKYYLNGRNEYYNRMKHEQRVNASLRGVITRMKRKERDSIRHD